MVAQAEEIPETILITGSPIRGTAAVVGIRFLPSIFWTILQVQSSACSRASRVSVRGDGWLSGRDRCGGKRRWGR
jgi:hypothetical protein